MELSDQVEHDHDGDHQPECASDEQQSAAPVARSQRPFAAVPDGGGMARHSGCAFDPTFDRQRTVLRQTEVRRPGGCIGWLTLLAHPSRIVSDGGAGKGHDEQFPTNGTYISPSSWVPLSGPVVLASSLLMIATTAGRDEKDRAAGKDAPARRCPHSTKPARSIGHITTLTRAWLRVDDS
jgi:hypothetical protein